jgi:FKBP-type peptidyl-prolyl cis-trans isomerase 2
VVELANGGMALVLEVNEKEVVMDANNMMAGKSLIFELDVVSITKGV